MMVADLERDPDIPRMPSGRLHACNVGMPDKSSLMHLLIWKGIPTLYACCLVGDRYLGELLQPWHAAICSAECENVLSDLVMLTGMLVCLPPGIELQGWSARVSLQAFAKWVQQAGLLIILSLSPMGPLAKSLA